MSAESLLTKSERDVVQLAGDGVRNNVAFTVTNTSMAGAYDSVTRSLAGYRTTGTATYATSVDANGNES